VKGYRKYYEYIPLDCLLLFDGRSQTLAFTSDHALPVSYNFLKSSFLVLMCELWQNISFPLGCANSKGHEATTTT